MTVATAPAPTAPDGGAVHWHTFGAGPVRPRKVDTGNGQTVIVDRSDPSRVIITVVSDVHGWSAVLSSSPRMSQPCCHF
jgi:hypothetical protein